MAFYTDEYKHLLEAERAIAKAIELPGENDSVAQLASALVRVVDQKRIMRGVPAPKAVDMDERKKAKARQLERITNGGPADWRKGKRGLKVIDVQDLSAPAGAPEPGTAIIPAPITVPPKPE